MKFIFVSIFMTMFALSCGWINGTTISGARIELSPQGDAYWLQRAFNTDALEKAYYFEQSLDKDQQKESTNQSVILMLKAQPKEAIKRLLHEESKKTYRYEVASNLGTAYELNGELDKALFWIKEAIKRNKNSHYNTEWLHVRILEVKLAMLKDSDYLMNHPVISQKDIYKYSWMGIQEAIEYQLGERMIFIKEKDPIIADILFSYAQLKAKNSILEVALEALDYAERYGFTDTHKLKEAKEKYQHIISYTDTKEMLWLVGYLLLFIALMIFAYKKRWLVLSKKQLKTSEISKQSPVKRTIGRILLYIGLISLVSMFVFPNPFSFVCIGFMLPGALLIRDAKAAEKSLK